MADFIPYSEKQKILTPKEWESQRFLDADCPTAQVATKMMRAVVKRLLQIDKNIDINDFVFLVYEDESPNAAFVSSHYTQNGKHIIMISPAITQLCKTEDEFAGVLAHELGHFTYDKIYGKNENTIFQERFSDLHAVDLLIAGGYDPSAYSRVCEEMRKFSGPNISPNVHGSDVARQEDVDAYLTKKHKEQGDFQIIAPTGLYKEFARAMNNRSAAIVMELVSAMVIIYLSCCKVIVQPPFI